MSWIAMKQRCSNPNNVGYRLYGARGIKVCKRWLGKQGFENFLADLGERPRDKTLDRKKNRLGYEPSNCRWATAAEQAQNTKTTKLNMKSANEIRSLAAQGFKRRTLATLFGISKSVIKNVLNNKAWL